MSEPDRDAIRRAVTAFYDEMPFNYRAATDGAERIRQVNQVARHYPDLHGVLSERGSLAVLDVGCGAGWLANTVAYHYAHHVTGIDLSEVALERAAATARELGVALRVELRREDLFERDDRHRYDVVTSIGVLHHTHDLAPAVAAVASRVRADGILYLGLYHKYGRAPFLELFRAYREKHEAGVLSGAEREEAFARYARMNPGVRDRDFLRSWFRDQVLHPHESQHTLAEVHELLSGLGFAIRSTSINRFAPIRRMEDLFESEKELYAYSVERNVREGRYFPGFFTVLARHERRPATQ